MKSHRQYLNRELDPEFAREYDAARIGVSFGMAVAARREGLGLTQQHLSEMTGIKQPMIARIERGQLPNTITIGRLAGALKARVEVTGEGISIVPLRRSPAVRRVARRAMAR
jgi:HTH-type transcriptional regulator/antitoxin HipB